MEISSLTIENRDYFSAVPEGYKGRIVFADENGSLTINLSNNACRNILELLRPLLAEAQADRLNEIIHCNRSEQ